MAARRLALIAAAIVLAGVVAIAPIVSVSREERPSTISAGSEEFIARGLADLAKASDAVIKGTVLEVGPGRTIDLGEGNILEYERATLHVDWVIKGSVVGDVINAEEYYDVLQWPWKKGDSESTSSTSRSNPNSQSQSIARRPAVCCGVSQQF
jgi:hypothetical protein